RDFADVDLSEFHGNPFLQVAGVMFSAPSLRSGRRKNMDQAKNWEAHGKQRGAIFCGRMLPRFLEFRGVFKNLQALCSLLRPPALRASHRRSLRSRRPGYGIRPGWAGWRLRNSECPALMSAGRRYAHAWPAHRAAAFVRLSAPDACVTIISVSFGGWPCISPIRVSSSSWSSALSRDGSRAE